MFHCIIYVRYLSETDESFSQLLDVDVRAEVTDKDVEVFCNIPTVFNTAQNMHSIFDVLVT